MIGDKKVLAWIPARGGSKGIKNKNIYDLCGSPLIAYTIHAALNSRYVDEVVVSTDSVEIADTAKRFGANVPSLRPSELATDTAKTIDAVMYSIKELQAAGKQFDIFCLLQPTSPLRDTKDIDGALEVYIENGCKPVVGVSEAEDHPLLIRSIDGSGQLKKLIDAGSTCRRQDFPPYYRVNGSIYINPVSEIDGNTSFNDNEIPYVMDRSHSVDIDDLSDIALAEFTLKNR